MQKFISLVALFLMCLQLDAQYKNDNVLYKTVYPEDLKQELKNHPGYILLDVRSIGENEDTSMITGLNIGRFRTAKNIDVRELPTKLNELQGYKNTPIFVYCSHSQRSRVASKILADNGFTKVYSINGGLSTLIQANYGLSDIYETKDKYHLLSPIEFCKQLNNKQTFLLDVRSDSAYNSTGKKEITNSIGKFKNAVHIPLTDLENHTSLIPSEKNIIIIDEYGDGSIKAATLLAAKGYKNIAVLFDGLYNLITTNTSEVSCKNDISQKNKNYHLLTSDEFNEFAKKSADVMIIDVRNSDEYNNQSKDAQRNTGHIKNAVNIPSSELQNKLVSLASYKNSPIVVYSSSRTEAYYSAALLANSGFTNVNILAGGIYPLRWKAANLKGKAHLKDWVVDIPSDNL